jgi:hypothetical protein
MFQEEKMITYYAYGLLGEGITWEDFIAADNNAPSVTIEVSDMLLIDGPAPDGWYDALVPGEFLTAKSARSVLAEINHVSIRDIVIVETGVAISI